MVAMANIGPEEEYDVAELVGSIRDVLDGRGERAWLEWAKEELMPKTTVIVATEKAEKEREAAEERERLAEAAKRQAEAEREAEKRRQEEEREAEHARRSGELWQRYQANAISLKEFHAGLAALDEAQSDADGEEETMQSEVEDVVDIPKTQAGAKRKVREGEEVESVAGDNRKVSNR
jgi:hypothetical protein